MVVSRRASLSYLDHPPLAFWIAHAVATLAGSENRVLLRAPFIVLFAGTTWLTYRLGARLFGERAGAFAALLLNLAPVFTLSTGGWILPDGPLDLALVAATLALSHVLLEPNPPRALHWWVAAGAATAVAFLSKYHAVFLVAGTLGFLLTRREARPWLRRREPYLAAAVALVGFVPVLVWNARHQFVSFRFQGGRAAGHGLHLGAMAQNLAGQAAYLLPWIWLLLLWELVRAVRAGRRDARRWLLASLGAGPVIIFTCISLGGNPGLPHWPAPGYLLLFPLAGDVLARWESRGRRARAAVRLGLVASGMVLVLLTGVAASQVATGWLTAARPRWFARGDPSLEAVDWTELRDQLDARGLLTGPHPVVAAAHWIDAAKLGYALGPRVAVLCLSDDPRHFQFAWPPMDYLGRDVLLLARLDGGHGGGSDRATESGHARESEDEATRVSARFAPLFSSIAPAETVAVHRNGRSVVRLLAFRAFRMRRAGE